MPFNINLINTVKGEKGYKIQNTKYKYKVQNTKYKYKIQKYKNINN